MDVLGLGLQLCKRAKQLFSGLLDSYSGAAAAYSLRKLNSLYSGPIVKVRRDSDQEELDFTSVSGVEDWVNGKQETTLPADIATSAAAYGLRKLRSAYTGNAFQIRRSYDDVEVNVQFDSNDKVSASSPITNVEDSGNLFPSQDITSWSLANVSASLSAEVSPVGGDVFDVSVSTGGSFRYAYEAISITSGSEYKLQFYVKANTAQWVWLLCESGAGGSSDEFAWFDIQNGSLGTKQGGITSTDIEAVGDGFYRIEAVFTPTNGGSQQIGIGFSNSNGSVSASSGQSIYLNEATLIERFDSGDTTATTLGGFLNEDIVTRTSDFSSSADGFISFSSDTITFNEDGIGGLDDNLSSTAGDTSSQVFGLNGAVSAGFEYKISVRYFIPQSNAGSYSEVSIRDGASIKIATDSSPATGSWVTLEGTATYTSPQIRIQFTGTSVAGDKVYIRELSISRTKQDATVVTWYDQSANANHATQTVAGDQPKIAEAGALLADGIDLRDSELDLSSSLSTDNYSVFTVNSGQSASVPYILKGDLNSPEMRVTASTVRLSSYPPVVTKVFTVSSVGSNQRIDSVFKDSNDDAQVFRNATESTSGTQNVGSGNAPFTTLGRKGDAGSIPVAEIIYFTSDQTSNRFKIESNINNYHDIYTASVNGFVRTWYDQSGNSNDAAQATENNQPKIVDAGSLVSGGLDFDGDRLDLSSEINTSSSHSLFVVAKTSTTSSGGGSDYPQLLGDNTSGKGFGFFANGLLDKSAGASNSLGLFTFASNTLEKILSVTSDNSNITAFQDGIASASNPIVDASFTNKFDRLGGSEQTSTYFDGTIQELIIYKSDQSANRSAIESNIADEYGITLP